MTMATAMATATVAATPSELDDSLPHLHMALHRETHLPFPSTRRRIHM
jgi:hypothetical protein